MNDDLSANLPAELDLPESLAPATKDHITMPPALVQAAQEDPEVLVQLSRAQLAVIQDRMVKRVLNDKDASISSLATVHKALSENAQLKGNAAAAGAGAGAQVVINFVIGGKKEPLTIDAATGKPE